MFFSHTKSHKLNSSETSEAASLVFRIGTVGLSLASAIVTAASTQCVYRDNGVPAGIIIHLPSLQLVSKHLAQEREQLIRRYIVPNAGACVPAALIKSAIG